ncbi:MAG: hypothetical protein IT204_04390 [Fimbriimonadaceae bacterium]|nr:hypothetical protein [Fimbriimonadaceae bacterium]
MITSRERVRRTLNHQAVDRAPRDLWARPGVYVRRSEEDRRLLEEFPTDFAGPRYHYGRAARASGSSQEVGEWTDAWGCRWRVLEFGSIGEVVAPPLADWASLAHYQPPWELLHEADLSEVNRSVGETDKYVKVGTETRPFERLQFLRGSEQLFYDLAYGDAHLHRCLAMCHDFFCQEMELWARTDVDGVCFMDDWGTQTALLISPEMWRAVFKPLYGDYCQILRSAGKDVWFHSDGHIAAVYRDLIEIGVTAQNSQLFCMDLEDLAARFNGQVTFWGEICRQNLLPFGTPEQCRAGVRRVRRAMDRGQGGVIAQFEWGTFDPYENAWAIYDEWAKPLADLAAD